MSLSKLLERYALHRERFPLSPGVCQAVICLNAVGQIATAAEPIGGVVNCTSREFIAVDGIEYCKACWTPMKGVNDGQEKISET